MPNPALPQRVPEERGVPGPWPSLPVAYVSAVAAVVREWGSVDSLESSRCRGADSPGSAGPICQGNQR